MAVGSSGLGGVGVGGIGAGVGAGGGIGRGGSVGGGIEAGRAAVMTGPALVSGLSRMDSSGPALVPFGTRQAFGANPARVFGPALEAGVSAVSRDGPVASLAGFKTEVTNKARAQIGSGLLPGDDRRIGQVGLENTMKLAIGQNEPVKEIVFNNPVKKNVSAEPLLAEADQVAIREVQAVIAQAVQTSVAEPVKQPAVELATTPVKGNVIRPNWAAVRDRAATAVRPAAVPGGLVEPKPAPESKAILAVRPKTENKVKEQLVEKLKEEVRVEQKEDEKNGIKSNEDVLETKVKVVEAVNVSKKREQEIETGVRKLAGISLIGRLLKNILSIRFLEAKSPLVGGKKDWTIDLIIEDIEVDTTVYKTPEQALKAWIAVTKKHIPVKKGQAGRTATVEEVNKVVHGRKDWLAPKTPAEMVIKRMVKKTIELAKTGEAVKILEDKTDIAVEGSLKDLNLEEVFLQKTT